MSEEISDVEFVNTIQFVQQACEKINMADKVGYVSLNAARNVFGPFYPQIITGLLVHMNNHRLVFEMIINAIIDDKSPTLMTNSGKVPPDNSASNRLFQYLRDGNRTPSRFLSFENSFQAITCSSFMCATRASFIRMVEDPSDFQKIKQNLDLTLLKVVSNIYHEWENKNSNLNNSVFQNKNPRELDDLRSKIMLSYEAKIFAYKRSLAKRNYVVEELRQLVDAECAAIDERKKVLLRGDQIEQPLPDLALALHEGSGEENGHVDPNLHVHKPGELGPDDLEDTPGPPPRASRNRRDVGREDLRLKTIRSYDLE